MENSSITNPTLVKTLNKFLIQPNPKNEQALISEVKKATFICPVQVPDEAKEGRYDSGQALTFKTLSTEEEYLFLMAFTDWEELEKWSKEPQNAIKITYDQLKSVIHESKGHLVGFTINPYEQNLMVTKDLIAYFDHFDAR